MATLIINPGSASKKYALYVGHKKFEDAHFESLGKKDFKLTLLNHHHPKITRTDYINSTQFLTNLLLQNKILKNITEIDSVGIRVVSPGKFFQKDRLIDDHFISKLKKKRLLAPLHIAPALKEIVNAKLALPHTKIIAVSDSAFHLSIPPKAHTYGINKKDAKKFGIRRFGYHGISFESVVEAIKILSKPSPKKVIVCHLGSGVSIAAIKNGKAVDTSMGQTPLEGPPMKTRVGSIDPGALLFLKSKKRLDAEKFEKYLNKSSGLKGISGGTGDIRELLAKYDKNKNAKLALDTFIYSIQKYIGAYYAILGGLDWLVFTATAGERAPSLRKLICKRLEHLGLNLDNEFNHSTIEKFGIISTKDSPVKIVVIPTNEEEQILKNTRLLV